MSIGQIYFLSDEQLLVTFVSRVAPQTLPRRNEPEASSNLRLHALFVDTKTGQLRATREWPTFSDRSRVAPATEGRSALVTPDRLVLYSPAMQPLKELSLPIGAEAVQGFWDAVPSPGGKYLLIWYDCRPDGTPRKSELVDAETLQVIRPWIEGSPWTEGRLVLAPFDDGNVLGIGPHSTVGFGPFDGPWRPFRAPWGDHCEPGPDTLINNQAIFGSTIVTPDRWCCTLALTTGELLFRQELAEKELVKYVEASAGGQRFAIAVYKGKGGSWALDIGPHYSLDRIMVYDIPSRRWIHTLTGKKQGIKSISGLAVSPDGSLLGAINQDGILEVYRVPQTPGSPPAQ
jgi:hypothetical protein